MYAASVRTSCVGAGFVGVTPRRGAFTAHPSRICTGYSFPGPVSASKGRRYRLHGLLACAAGMSAIRRRKVAVIGGGPAGMATCRFLDDFGHSPTVFEAGDESGGIWAPRPINHVVYQGLVTNIPTMCMQSFDLELMASNH